MRRWRAGAAVAALAMTVTACGTAPHAAKAATYKPAVAVPLFSLAVPMRVGARVPLEVTAPPPDAAQLWIQAPDGRWRGTAYRRAWWSYQWAPHAPGVYRMVVYAATPTDVAAHDWRAAKRSHVFRFVVRPPKRRP
jgi:hypothetical protein